MRKYYFLLSLVAFFFGNLISQSNLILEARFDPLVVALDNDSMYLKIELEISGIDSIVLYGIPYHIRENGFTDPDTELKLLDNGLGSDEIANDKIFTSEPITVKFSNLIPSVDNLTIGFERFDYTVNTVFYHSNTFVDTFYHDYGLVIRYFDMDSITIPNIINLGDTVQIADHVCQFIVTPQGNYPNYQLDYSSINSFYNLFPDDYDFIGYNWLIPHHVIGQHSAFHSAISNDVSGIGRPIFNNASSYGSSGRLKSRSTFVRNFDLHTLCHEINHQWSSFIPFLKRSNSHWSWIKDNSSGFGGIVPYNGVFSDFIDIGNNEYAGIYPISSNEPNDASMNNIELYLAGAYPVDSIQGPIEYFHESSYIGFATVPINGVNRKVVKFNAPKLFLDFVEVTDSIGYRTPNVNNSQKDFNLAGILIYDRKLDSTEMAYFNFYYLEFGKNETHFNDFSDISFYELSKGNLTLNTELQPRSDLVLTMDSMLLSEKPIQNLFTINGSLEDYQIKLLDPNNNLIQLFTNNGRSLTIDLNANGNISNYVELTNIYNSYLYLKLNLN